MVPRCPAARKAAAAFVSGTLLVWLGLAVRRRRRFADRGLARAARARPAGAR
jgi:hypothetical protein